ncbi:hypothetical protein E8E13_007914 [Curvularia kusanoi]|uniref:Transmembrane protein n=1 Tax=Curvularia kusanoi TaxID=90978 RepID=A0A9P4TL68_CURKU|nr:hypothetical protein E8E13_007914 [Curvularia kusanoi]
MSRKAEPEHEMNDLRRHSMDTALLDRTGGNATTPSKQRGLKIRDWIRQLRLQILLLRFRRPSALKASAERRKVAVYHSRQVAISHALLHLIPLGGAISLLYLQWTQTFLGWGAPPDATMLQFVAKFHELLMQVSIVEVMLCIVRAEATRGFVPLGALSGIVQATQLSYLWSLDFLSLFTSAALRGWRKIFLAVSFPILLGITALVGPSSAVLMIPRQGIAHVGQSLTVLANASEQSIFPSNISHVNGLTLDWTILEESLKLGNKVPYEEDNDLIEYGELYVLAQRRPLRITTLAHNVDTPFTPSTEIQYLQDDMTTLGVLSDLGTIIERVRGQSVLSPDKNSNITLQYFAPVWTASPEQGSHAWIGTFIYASLSLGTNATGDQAWPTEPIRLASLVSSHNTSQEVDIVAGVFACTLSAVWNNSEALFSGLTRTGDMEQTPIWNTDAGQPITMNLTGIPEFGGAKFLQYLVEFDGNLILSGKILAAAFATAISDIPGAEWLRQNETNLLADMADTTAYTITNTYFGSGYGATTTSVRLSIAVICTYCVIIICYLAFTLITGYSSTAWNSAIELVALALQSKKPDHLGSVSVGIDNLGTFNEGVGIRVNADNELELVFAHDRDIGARDLRKIQKNREY